MQGCGHFEEDLGVLMMVEKIPPFIKLQMVVPLGKK